jgi:hypothetical protein
MRPHDEALSCRALPSGVSCCAPSFSPLNWLTARLSPSPVSSTPEQASSFSLNTTAPWANDADGSWRYDGAGLKLLKGGTDCGHF